MANPFRRRPRALVASAARIDGQQATRPPSGVSVNDARQAEAWRFYDEIPEVGTAGNYIAKATGKLRLYAGVRVEADQPPVSVAEVDDPKAVAERGERVLPPGLAEAAAEELARIRSPQGGQSALLKTASLNLFVPGEFYTVGVPEQRDELGRVRTPESWSVRSKDEIKRTSRKHPGTDDPIFELHESPGGNEGVDLPPGTVVVRTWSPHPRFSALADSSVLRLIGTLDDYQALSRSISGSAKSKTSAGLLYVSAEIDLPVPPNVTPDASPDEVEQQAALELMRMQVAPIADPGSAASVARTILRGPYAYKDGIVPIDLNRAVDKIAAEQRGEVRKIVAVCLDAATEILDKRDNINHWGMWFIGDETATSYVFPNAELICDSWTTSLLHPALAERGFAPEDYERVVVWYDPGDLVVRPNRAEDARQLFDRGAVGPDYLREAHNVPDTAAPTPEQRTEMLEFASTKRPGDVPVGETQGPPDTDPAGRRAVVAAVQPPGLPTLGERLSRQEVALRQKLHGYLEAQARQALDRAGARAKSRVASGGAQGRQFGAVYSLVQEERNARAIPSLVGRRLLAAAGLTEDELLADAFSEVGAQFLTWTAATRTVALADIRASTGMSERQAAALAAELEANTTIASGALVGALTALAAARLYDPDPNAPDEGEWDDGLLVPLGLVRGALAVAGGGAAGVESPGIDLWTGLPALAAAAGIALGFTLGPTIFGGLRANGVEPEGYTWEYGVSSRPFPPHAALDGTTFANFDDPALANYGSFPPVDFFMPGDHAGCSCSAAPTFMVRESPVPEFKPTGEPLAAAALNGHRR